jgi:hypothetical protein
MKVSSSLRNYKSLKSIDFDHKEEKSNEDLKDQRKIKIIGIDYIVIYGKTSINLMNQHIMKMLIDHDYIVS